MYKASCRLSGALWAQMKNVVNLRVGGSVMIPRSNSSSLPPDEEGFGGDLTIGEQKLIAKLRKEYPNATHLEVSDVSGGCGAMYQISIETPEFIGKRKLQQQQMVNKVLAEEIKEMHGLQLNTQAPENSN